MKVYKGEQTITVELENGYYTFKDRDWAHFINRPDLYKEILKDINANSYSERLSQFDGYGLKAPISNQEVWAAGVTYLRSKEARMEESKEVGASSFYNLVYDADRPEIFFKATADRVVGHQEEIFIRQDSNWNVPEPELTLFVSSEGSIEGYTIGNDMSSRSIEGENPLYLPQAKIYDKCASLGPCLYVSDTPISRDTQIEMQIIRKGSAVFKGQIGIDQMKRSHEELVEFLTRECSFKNGCFLMTGTSLVPEDNFTLKVNDIVEITISPIGKLTNKVSHR